MNNLGDYDQGSDEDENTQLAYPKAVTLQEVELMTADTTDDELASYELQKQLVDKLSTYLRRLIFLSRSSYKCIYVGINVILLARLVL